MSPMMSLWPLGRFCSFEDGDVLAYEAVCDSSPAIYVGALHDDGVLYLGVSDGGVVSDAGVGTDKGCWANVVVSNDGGGLMMAVRI